MQVFYTTLIVTSILGLITRLTSNKYKYIKYFFVILIAAIFVGVAGSRTGIGDTYYYKHAYEMLAQNPILPEDGKDLGFTLFQLMLIMISTNPQFLVFVTSFITQAFNILGLYKYHNFFELQIYMYITSGYWLTTMNGIRQSMVAAILFTCTPLIIRGKKNIFFLIIILLSNIHGSALIMIPVYFIVREKPWSKKIWTMICLGIFGFLLYDILEPLIWNIIGQTQYGNYTNSTEGGSSFIRAFIGTLPVVLSYMLKDSLDDDGTTNIFINMSLLNMIILYFSMYNWIFARLCIYFQMYNFVLFPKIIMTWGDKKQQRLLYYGFLVCYFIFMYYEQVIQGLGLGYKSIISWF